jgi:hypothetical protein
MTVRTESNLGVPFCCIHSGRRSLCCGDCQALYSDSDLGKCGSEAVKSDESASLTDGNFLEISAMSTLMDTM